MKRRLLLLFFAILLPFSVVGNGTSDEVERLSKEMYRLYATDSTEQFKAVIEELKTECLKAGDEQMFYKAWNNLASHVSSKGNREQGLAIAHEAHKYAQEHNSKYGLYSSIQVIANIQSTMQMLDPAEKGYLEALEYHDKFFPKESAAYIYIGLAKIYQNRHDIPKLISVCEKALAQPNVIPIHQANAWSYICVASAELIDKNIDVEENKAKFEHAYKECKKIVNEHNFRRNYLIEYYRSKLRRDADSMIYWAEKIQIPLTKKGFIPYGYFYKGDYLTAFNKYVEYKRFSDSINSAQMQKQAAEMGLQLDLARAENEAKDLRIAADINRERVQKIQLWSAIGIGLLILGFMVFYIYRRNKHAKEIEDAYGRLETAHEKLEDAYGKLEETTAAKERIESELRIAREIQMGMVPRIFPAFPNRSDIDVYASLDSAKEVGGDLYDFFLQADHLYFCIGDVSGKGIPASLFMSVVVNLFRMVAKEGFPPEYVATKLNETLANDNDNGMFCTMFIGEIDLLTGRMSYCNAGHNPPLIIDRPLVPHEPCRPTYLEMEPNAPIGLWQDLEYVGESVSNVKGRTIFLYTDGLSEAENISREQFGEDRLIEVFRTRPYDNAQQTIDIVNSTVTAFVGDAEQSDDQTMLCLKIL